MITTSKRFYRILCVSKSRKWSLSYCMQPSHVFLWGRWRVFLIYEIFFIFLMPSKGKLSNATRFPKESWTCRLYFNKLLLLPSHKNLPYWTHSSSQSIPHSRATINILVSFLPLNTSIVKQIEFHIKASHSQSQAYIMRICIWKFHKTTIEKKKKAGRRWMMKTYHWK